MIADLIDRYPDVEAPVVLQRIQEKGVGGKR